MSYQKSLAYFRFSYPLALTLFSLLFFGASACTASQTVRVALPISSKTQFSCYAGRRVDFQGLVHYEGRLPQRPRRADSVYYMIRRGSKNNLVKESFKIAIPPSGIKGPSLRVVWKYTKNGFVEGLQMGGKVLRHTNLSNLSGNDAVKVIVVVPLVLASAYSIFRAASSLAHVKRGKSREILLSSRKYKYDKGLRLIREEMYVYEEKKEARLLSVTRYFYKGSTNSVSRRVIQNKLTGKTVIKQRK